MIGPNSQGVFHFACVSAAIVDASNAALMVADMVQRRHSGGHGAAAGRGCSKPESDTAEAGWNLRDRSQVDLEVPAQMYDPTPWKGSPIFPLWSGR